MRKEGRNRRKKGGREGIEKAIINEEIKKKRKKAGSSLGTREKKKRDGKKVAINGRMKRSKHKRSK